ncbi:MAG: hypothetical protein J6P61_01390 [Erysipelotrichaceae bacterium]|nr:hypothetical protein [Erysipelotrichaceae bacterium]
MQNTIVLSASTLRIGRDGIVTSDDAFYKDDEGKEIVISQYYSQLEPVIRYMLSVINTRNDITDKTLNIVMLCTEEVKNVASFKEKNGNDYCMNAVEYLKHRINVCEEKETGQTIDFETIDLDKRKPYKAIRETIEKIRSIKAETNDVKGLFWVDVHGGLRQIAMALEAIISLLEIDEIIPDDIFSVEYSREENKSEITNENELFKI